MCYLAEEGGGWVVVAAHKHAAEKTPLLEFLKGPVEDR